MTSPFASLGRLRQVTAVVARHGLMHYVERRRVRAKARSAGDGPPPDEREATEAAARRFRAILIDLGPTFVKFGQVLSTRADLLPLGFAEALSDLQDQCPPMSEADTELMLREGLGRPVSEMFSELDMQPVASASIAQVHRAVTHEGEEVAVKVQRRGAQESILGDLDLLHFLAQLVESIVQESGLVTPRAVVDEFEAAFLAELDFENEARMMQRFHANTVGKQRAYVVPRVYEELSSRTVLTMEFLHGTRLSELGPQHDRKQVAANIVHAAFEQLFVDGLFHADPHPGNALVLDDNRFALLDFGCVSELSYTMRETLVVLVVAIGMRDADTVARLLYREGIPDKRISLHRLRDACASLFNRYLRDQSTLANVEASQLLKELFELAARFGVRMPSEYALIARASVVVEGIIRGLDPQLEVLKTAGPYVKQLVSEQFAMPELGDSALRGLLQARGLIRELPLISSQILMDLESGKLQVQLANPSLSAIARNIDALGVTVFMGLVAGALIAGSFFALARQDWELWGIPVLPSIGLLVAGMLFGAAVGRYLLSPRLLKISAERWFGKRRRRR